MVIIEDCGYSFTVDISCDSISLNSKTSLLLKASFIIRSQLWAGTFFPRCIHEADRFASWASVVAEEKR